jgi:hypothetical protein
MTVNLVAAEKLDGPVELALLTTKSQRRDRSARRAPGLGGQST